MAVTTSSLFAILSFTIWFPTLNPSTYLFWVGHEIPNVCTRQSTFNWKIFVAPCSYWKLCAYRLWLSNTQDAAKSERDFQWAGESFFTPPKGNLPPGSLLSPSDHAWAIAFERIQKPYFDIREMSFYFYSSPIGKNRRNFLSKFPETFPSVAGCV